MAMTYVQPTAVTLKGDFVSLDVDARDPLLKFLLYRGPMEIDVVIAGKNRDLILSASSSPKASNTPGCPARMQSSFSTDSLSEHQ